MHIVWVWHVVVWHVVWGVGQANDSQDVRAQKNERKELQAVRRAVGIAGAASAMSAVTALQQQTEHRKSSLIKVEPVSEAVSGALQPQMREDTVEPV